MRKFWTVSPAGAVIAWNYGMKRNCWDRGKYRKGALAYHWLRKAWMYNLLFKYFLGFYYFGKCANPFIWYSFHWSHHYLIWTPLTSKFLFLNLSSIFYFLFLGKHWCHIPPPSQMAPKLWWYFYLNSCSYACIVYLFSTSPLQIGLLSGLMKSSLLVMFIIISLSPSSGIGSDCIYSCMDRKCTFELCAKSGSPTRRWWI